MPENCRETEKKQKDISPISIRKLTPIQMPHVDINELKQSKDYSLRKRYRKFMEKEIQIINIHLSMMKGELDDYEIFSRKTDWKKGKNLMLVTHRWMDARAHYIKNEMEAAKADCRFVIEKGNRLYYTGLAREMLESLEPAAPVHTAYEYATQHAAQE